MQRSAIFLGRANHPDRGPGARPRFLRANRSARQRQASQPSREPSASCNHGSISAAPPTRCSNSQRQRACQSRPGRYPSARNRKSLRNRDQVSCFGPRGRRAWLAIALAGGFESSRPDHSHRQKRPACAGFFAVRSFLHPRRSLGWSRAGCRCVSVLQPSECECGDSRGVLCGEESGPRRNLPRVPVWERRWRRTPKP